MEVTRDLPLQEHTFAVVDVETTGLSTRTGDRICEVAVVLARGGQIVDQLQTLVNPQKPISRGAAAVNGITDGMVRNSPAFHEVAPALLETRLRERTGHFASPDILDSQLRELERPRHELTLPAQLPVDALVDTICTELGLTPIRSRQPGG